MTLQEAKEQVAKKYLFNNWQTLIDWCSPSTTDDYHDEAAELYARSNSERLGNKTATQILFENGIDIMSLDDKFNTSLLQAMEEYAAQFIGGVPNY